MVYRTGKEWLRKHKSKLILIALFWLLCIWAFWNGLVVTRYEISSDKIDGEVKIVLITDLHSHIYGKKQKDLADRIRTQNPDVILLGGDIADDGTPIEGTEQFLSAIRDIADIYYVTGNHEFWADDIERIKRVIDSYGVTILENQYAEIVIHQNKIILGGVEDPDSFRGSYDSKGFAYAKEKLQNGNDTYTSWDEMVEQAFEDLEIADGYGILLSHRPEKTGLYARLPFDLIVSGHAHGGQVRIPFLLNGLFAPNQGFFPKYAGGLYEYEGRTHIVSRGVSFKPRLPRVFNPPEIVVIRLKSRATVSL